MVHFDAGTMDGGIHLISHIFFGFPIYIPTETSPENVWHFFVHSGSLLSMIGKLIISIALSVCLLTFASKVSSAPSFICPDGTPVDAGPCQLCKYEGEDFPVNHYIGSNKACPTMETSRGTIAADKASTSIASFLFASPGQYPPEDFSAYGLVIFTQRPAAIESLEARHMFFCKAYMAVDSPSEGGQQTAQLATVWPLTLKSEDNKLYSILPVEAACSQAVQYYDYDLAKQIAHSIGDSADGEGPFLVAWSPGTEFRKPGVTLLFDDLSDVKTPEQAIAAFKMWRKDIERDPVLWKNGWSLERLRITLQRNADNLGEGLLRILGTK